MPHHAVIKSSSSTTKVRIVFDASSKSRDANSLNQCLEKGVIRYADIFGVLIRMRMHKILLMGDLEKAFLQISVRKENRDFCVFCGLKTLQKKTKKL